MIHTSFPILNRVNAIKSSMSKASLEDFKLPFGLSIYLSLYLCTSHYNQISKHVRVFGK